MSLTRVSAFPIALRLVVYLLYLLCLSFSPPRLPAHSSLCAQPWVWDSLNSLALRVFVHAVPASNIFLPFDLLANSYSSFKSQPKCFFCAAVPRMPPPQPSIQLISCRNSFNVYLNKRMKTEEGRAQSVLGQEERENGRVSTRAWAWVSGLVGCWV